MPEAAAGPFALAMLRTHPAAAAQLLEAQDPADLAAFLCAVEPHEPVAALVEMPPSYVARALRLVSPDALLAIARELPLATLAALLRCLDAARQQLVLDSMPARKRLLVSPAHFSERDVGAWLDLDSVIVPPRASVREALRRSRRHAGDELGVIALVDHDGRYLGAVDAAALIRIPINTAVAKLIDPELLPLPASLPIREAIAHPAWQRYRSMPVTDAREQYLGAISFRSLGRALTATGSGHDEPGGDAFGSLWGVYSAGLGALATMFMRILDSGTASDRDEEPGDGR